MEVSVGATLDGERVDRAVALLCGLPRAEVSSLVDAGAIRLDGRPVSARGRRVRAGQALSVDLPEASGAGPVPGADPSVALSVVYEDRDLIVVDKPAGVVVHPGAGNHTGTLVNGLLARYPDLAGLAAGAGADPERPGIVHRLDKGTSGLLVVARSARARDALVAELAAHRVERLYLALVLGAVAADEGTIDAPLQRSNRDPTRITVQAGGREARTHYRVETRFAAPEPLSLLECRLETGRTHQIRVHLAAIGHPVAGDGRYGGPRRATVGELLVADRPWLHARSLAFTHPVTGRRLELRSPLPPELQAVLDVLS